MNMQFGRRVRQEVCLTLPLGIQHLLPYFWEWKGTWRIGPFENEEAAKAWEAKLYGALLMKTASMTAEKYTIFMLEQRTKRPYELTCLPPGKGVADIEAHFVLDVGTLSCHRPGMVEYHTDPRGLSVHELAGEFDDFTRTLIRKIVDE